MRASVSCSPRERTIEVAQDTVFLIWHSPDVRLVSPGANVMIWYFPAGFAYLTTIHGLLCQLCQLFVSQLVTNKLD